jgi:hypothetical protein
MSDFVDARRCERFEGGEGGGGVYKLIDQIFDVQVGVEDVDMHYVSVGIANVPYSVVRG